MVGQNLRTLSFNIGPPTPTTQYYGKKLPVICAIIAFSRREGFGVIGKWAPSLGKYTTHSMITSISLNDKVRMHVGQKKDRRRAKGLFE